MRPLVYGRRRAVVDGHPICGVRDRGRAGRAGPVAASGAGRAVSVLDSPWLAPVTWAELRDLTTFACFTDRYPDVARDVSEEDWREGRRRWAAYQERLQSRAGEYRLLDLVKILVGGRVTPGFLPIPEPLARVLDLDGRRRELASRFSWAIPTEAALGLIGDHGPLLEAGVGTGYWAALSRERGIDVRPTDADPAGHTYHRDGQVWTEVQRSDAVDAVRTWPDRTLLICWPPPDDDAAGYAAVRAYAGDTVLYIGGGEDGPTGTARLHRELDLNWTVTDELALPSWPGNSGSAHPSGGAHRCGARCGSGCARSAPGSYRQGRPDAVTGASGPGRPRSPCGRERT